MKEVIVTYSWDSEEHTQKVISFTDWLRQKGFDAHIDRMLAQEQTAIDFKKMMHQAMTDYKSVIIILSPGYKLRAESFTGGVGTEYGLVIKDIDDNPQKYILASFDGRGKEVTPLSFSDREVVDLNSANGHDRLFRKLLNTPELIFSSVGHLKPQLEPLAIPAFQEDTPKNSTVSIKNLVAKEGSSMRQGGIYNRSDFDISVNIINDGPNPIDQYSVEFYLPFELLVRPHEYPVEEGYAVIKEDFTSRLYKGQSKMTHSCRTQVTTSNIMKVIGKPILVKVYSGAGVEEKTFQASDVFRLRRDNGMDPVPLSVALFTGYDL